MWRKRAWLGPGLAATCVVAAALVPGVPGGRAADAAVGVERVRAVRSGGAGRPVGPAAPWTAAVLPSRAARSAGPTAPTGPTAVPAAPAAAPRRFTLVATGDVLVHAQVRRQAAADAARAGRPGMDFAPMLAAVRPYVSAADLALCHLETPLAPPGGPYTGYPVFAAPPQVVTGLKVTGYDACSTASNHSFDGGATGVARTLSTLDRAGMAHAGSARTPAEAARTTLVWANGVTVALLSYTYGFNGIRYPGGDRWRANLIDVRAITAAARLARRRGAEVVVLSLHWGTEYQQTPNAQQRAIAPVLAASPDIDVIIGHHAHVVLPVQRIGRTWVVYGLGNLVAASADWGSANAEGLLVRFGFTENASGRFDVTLAQYQPLLVTRSPLRVVDVSAALARGGPAARTRLQTALRRTTAVVTSRGADDAGLVRIAPSR